MSFGAKVDIQSVVTVGYIDSQTTVDDRRRLLGLLGKGFSIDQALHEVMGLDTQSLDRAVQSDIRAEFPEWAMPAAPEARIDVEIGSGPESDSEAMESGGLERVAR